MATAEDTASKDEPQPSEAKDSPKNKETNVEISEVATNTLKQLENLIEESLQVYELENQKSATIDELFNSLKIITQFLSFTVNVDPGIFNVDQETNITLLPQLELVFRKANGKTEIKKLDEFPPEILTKILEYVIPLIVDLIRKEKAYLSEKISFLRSATKQLKQLHNLKEAVASDSPVAKETVVVEGEN